MDSKGILVAGVSVMALSGAVFAFLTNASPYVTVAQAMQSKSDSLHVAGDILKPTLQVNSAARQCRFTLRDKAGQTLEVVSSDIPANMGDATQVVAVGGMDGDEFKAHKLLVKCPSKYESEDSNTSKS